MAPEELQSLPTEVSNLASLDHPHIVRYADAFRAHTDGAPLCSRLGKCAVWGGMGHAVGAGTRCALRDLGTDGRWAFVGWDGASTVVACSEQQFVPAFLARTASATHPECSKRRWESME